MRNFIAQNIWTIRHALSWPAGYHHDYLSLILPCPALWVLACFADGFKTWKWIVGLFVLAFAIVPVSRYCLPAIPFLCLLAAQGFHELNWNGSYSRFNVVMFFLIIISFPIVGHVFADIVRPWRSHPYGLMDTRYIANKLPKNLKPPIWTNDCDLYLATGWKVPVNDFYDIAEVPGSVIDWSKPPFRAVQTRVELLPTATAMGQEPDKIPGWRTEVLPLSRGQFTKLRIRRRM